jgi:hypothetical protein
MSRPSQVLGAGINGLASVAVCGNGAGSLTATGSTRSDALRLTAVYNLIATAAAGTGILLPPCEMGSTIWVANDGANTVSVYPAESTVVTINGTSSGSIPTAKTTTFIAISNTVWITQQGSKS